MCQPVNATPNAIGATAESLRTTAVLHTSSAADAPESLAPSQHLQTHNLPLFFLHKHLSIALVREKNRFGKTQWGLDVQVKRS